MENGRGVDPGGLLYQLRKEDNTIVSRKDNRIMNVSRAVLTALFCAAVWLNGVQAQDIVVLKNGDTIRCKILDVNFEFIKVQLVRDNETVKTKIPMINVYDHEIGGDLLEEDFVIMYPKALIPVPESPWVRLAAFGGWSYLLASVADDMDPFLRDYFNGLKVGGGHFGADLSFFFSRSWGAGLRYCGYAVRKEVYPVMVQYPNGQVNQGMMRDEIMTHLIGPGITSQSLFARGKGHFIWNLAGGYASYSNNGMLVHPIHITSSTFGMSTSLNLDLAVSNEFAVGLGLTYLLAIYGSMDVNFQGSRYTLSENSNLSRIDVSLALKWFKPRK